MEDGYSSPDKEIGLSAETYGKVIGWTDIKWITIHLICVLFGNRNIDRKPVGFMQSIRLCRYEALM